MQNIKERKSFKFIVATFALMLGVVFMTPSMMQNVNAASKPVITYTKWTGDYDKTQTITVRWKYPSKSQKNSNVYYQVHYKKYVGDKSETITTGPLSSKTKAKYQYFKRRFGTFGVETLKKIRIKFGKNGKWSNWKKLSFSC